MTFMIRAAVLAALLPCVVLAQTPPRPAADREAYARLPVCKLRPDGRGLAVEPCRTAPPRRPMPRRPVPQQIEPTQRIPSPSAPADVADAPAPPSAPVTLFELTPRTGPTAVVTPAPGTSVTPPPSPYVNHAPGAFAAPPPGVSQPVPATCGPGGCRDAAGTQYNGSRVLTSPTGRLCSSGGGVVTCM